MDAKFQELTNKQTLNLKTKQTKRQPDLYLSSFKIELIKIMKTLNYNFLWLIFSKA